MIYESNNKYKFLCTKTETKNKTWRPYAQLTKKILAIPLGLIFML